MKKPRICLFTAHPPTGGGGGAILRSLVPELAAEYEVSWYYVSAQAAAGYESGWLGAPVIGRSNFVVDMAATAALLAGHKSKAWELLLEKMSSLECDAYWIVSHNEGLCLARDLELRTNRPIHLTVHDDWVGALCARSQRYRFLAPLADRVTDSVLGKVRSVDVVSEGMQRFYHDRTGVDAVVVHRPIPWRKMQQPPVLPGELRVGHLGSVYSKADFQVFLKALKSYGEEQGLTPRITLWGAHLKPADLPSDLSSIVEFRPTTEEAQVIEELQQCRFVYAMYPFAENLATFVRTSLPTKLSTYVMAQRPILGHAPKNSTLATFLQKTTLGSLWDSLDLAEGKRAIDQVLSWDNIEDLWGDGREMFFGENNVQRIKASLNRARTVAIKK